MSEFSETLRAFIVARARGRCEYCRLPSEGQVGRFPIDHVLPRSAGGSTTPENLALACHHCNVHKWAFHEAPDPLTGAIVPLFHPRTQTWTDHFDLLVDPPFHLIGLGPTGRATIERLRMNHPDLIAARRLLAALGLYPPVGE